MNPTLYKIIPTGVVEWWGAGIMTNPPVTRIGPSFLLVNEGYTVDDVINPTITLEEASVEEQERYAEEIQKVLNPETEQESEQS